MPSTASPSTSRRGEVLGLVGESGSGKSVTGLADPRPRRRARAHRAGSIRLEGEELVGTPEARDAAPARQRLAMIFQDPDDHA